MFLRKTRAATLAISAGTIVLLGLGGVDRYLFARRLARTDPKYFYHDVQTLVRRVRAPEHEPVDASYVLSGPKVQSYRVALTTDRLIVLYTHSFTSSAYLTFSRSDADDAWDVGWLRDANFSRVGTFRF